ncbi:unnamed protein product [Aphis gossypii]|uniref:Uncharacterized protein n=1 Tax=Aphis gossypii TaxID=80765 RepID=A0A9P0J3I5_APHGO|nr:unnamed protein product [Aphis gossypii]
MGLDIIYMYNVYRPFRCKSDTLCATDRVSVFHRQRMRGGPGGVCNEYTRLGTKLIRTTTAAADAGRPPLPSPHHTAKRCAARSGDFMACTVITLYGYIEPMAAEALSQVSDNDYNFFFYLYFFFFFFFYSLSSYSSVVKLFLPRHTIIYPSHTSSASSSAPSSHDLTLYNQPDTHPSGTTRNGSHNRS